MANFDLKFIDTVDQKGYIKVKTQTTDADGGFLKNQFINISGFSEWSKQDFMISLDKSTAIKFAKTLRTEINLIKD